MTAMFKRCTRRIAPLFLAVGLILSPSMTPTLRAQEEPPAPEGGESKGRPWDGYFGTGVLVMFALWVVGKSARR